MKKKNKILLLQKSSDLLEDSARHFVKEVFCFSKKGNSTLEILIAFAVLILGITAAVSIGFGNQSIAVDSQTDAVATSQASAFLQNARTLATQNYLAVVSTTSVQTVNGVVYTDSLFVTDATQCKKQATSSVSWLAAADRPEKVEFSTYLSDVAGALLLGGDCVLDTPRSVWNNPQISSAQTLPANPTSLDELNGAVYEGATSTAPYLFISNPAPLVFKNNFSAGAGINALDVANWYDSSGNAKQYVYAAMNATTSQFEVIDVTDKNNPVVVAKRTLLSVDPTGSFPQGYRVYYFGNRVYFLTRETKGPEFHIFNVTDPTNPVELGSGVSLGIPTKTETPGITVNDIVVQDQWVNGSIKRFMYLATHEAKGEVRVFDVTDPTNTETISEVVAARQSLLVNGTAQPAESMYLVGSNLYVGAASTTASGAGIYLFDATNPALGMPLVRSYNVGLYDVDHMIVAGRFAFIAAVNSRAFAFNQLQVWDVSKNSTAPVSRLSIPNLAWLDYDSAPDTVYAAGLGTNGLSVVGSQ